VGIKESQSRAKRRDQILKLLRKAEPAYRHLTPSGRTRSDKTFLEVPCAGTVTVGFPANDPLVVRPRPEDHQLVVDEWSHPWCRGGEPEPVDDVSELLDLLLD